MENFDVEKYLNVFNKKIDYIEIHPLIGLNDKFDTVELYEDATGFEQADSDDGPIIAWGVYAHVKGVGLECLFDVVDECNAGLAQSVLNRILNLET
jgi:hypothetical protein